MNGGPNLNGMMGNLQQAMGNAVGAMKQMGDLANKFEQIQKIVSLIQRGGNPIELLASFAQQDPQAGQMMQNLNGKSQEELRTYAENMAKSYGTSLDEVAQRLGITLPR